MKTKTFNVELEIELEAPENIEVDGIVVKDQIDRALESSSAKDSELVASGSVKNIEEGDSNSS